MDLYGFCHKCCCLVIFMISLVAGWMKLGEEARFIAVF